MKIDWIIYRTDQNEKGTISENLVRQRTGFFEPVFYNLELPYKSNACNISCIPAGIYPFEKRNDYRLGKTIRILNVPNRTGILVHVGNYLKDTEGCILPCQSKRINKEGTQFVGIESKRCIDELWETLPVSGYIHIVSQS